jgi:hypothetical protein
MPSATQVGLAFIFFSFQPLHGIPRPQHQAHPRRALQPVARTDPTDLLPVYREAKLVPAVDELDDARCSNDRRRAFAQMVVDCPVGAPPRPIAEVGGPAGAPLGRPCLLTISQSRRTYLNFCWGPNTGATRPKRLRAVQFLLQIGQESYKKNRELHGMWVACKSAGSATVCSVAATFPHDRASWQGPAEAESVMKRTGNNPVQAVPVAGYDDGLLSLRSHPRLTSGLERALAGERGSGADRIS